MAYARALIGIYPKKELPTSIFNFLSERVTSHVWVSFLWKPPICSACRYFRHTDSTCVRSLPSDDSTPKIPIPPLSPLRKVKAMVWRAKPFVVAQPDVSPDSFTKAAPEKLQASLSPPVVKAPDHSYNKSLSPLPSTPDFDFSNTDDLDEGIEYDLHQIAHVSMSTDPT